MKWQNNYRVTLASLAGIAILLGVAVAGGAMAQMNSYDPGDALLWLGIGNSLFGLGVLSFIAWLVVSALTLSDDHRAEVAAISARTAAELADATAAANN